MCTFGVCKTDLNFQDNTSILNYVIEFLKTNNDQILGTQNKNIFLAIPQLFFEL